MTAYTHWDRWNASRYVGSWYINVQIQRNFAIRIVVEISRWPFFNITLGWAAFSVGLES